MAQHGRGMPGVLLGAVAVFCAASLGCHGTALLVPPETPLPRELSKTSHPSYVVEPPDILNINAIRVIPLGAQKIEPYDILTVQVTGLAPNATPIEGQYAVDPQGNLNLGIEYGLFPVAGLTMQEAQAGLERFLKQQGVLM